MSTRDFSSKKGGWANKLKTDFVTVSVSSAFGICKFLNELNKDLGSGGIVACFYLVYFPLATTTCQQQWLSYVGRSRNQERAT